MYDQQGARDKTLEYYRQALDLTREFKGYAAAGAINSLVVLHLKAKQPERAAQFIEEEIARARIAKDAETEKLFGEILNQIKNGTNNK